MAVRARRHEGIRPTIFSEMSALAVRTGSVNLGQGFPDSSGPASLLQDAADAIHAGRNQYAPGTGVPTLRRAIAAHQERHYGLTVDPDTEVCVTTGATEGIAAALLGLVDPGDEVVVLEPYYDSYVAMLQMAGGVRRPVTLHAPDFRPDPDELRAAVTDDTALILLNSPHNPTGTVLTQAELTLIAELAVAHDALVVTDEVYEHLVFDGHPHVPLATLPGMAERTLTLSSAGKSYSVTGWKVGWATGPAAMVQALLAAKQWLSFTSGTPLQHAVARALEQEAAAAFPRQLAADLQQRRDTLCAGLTAAGLAPRVPEGTYFALTDVAGLGWHDSLAFCQALPERAGVVAVPAQVFYENEGAGGPGQHIVRWAFCKDADELDRGLERLAAADLTAG